MQTISGVGSSLWRKSGAGLYLQTSRMRFPLNGLVFYAPLWHPELSISPFISKDLNAHSCTVIGATWGATGRTAAGGDDYIDCGKGVALSLTGALTIEGWAQVTSIAAYNTFLANFNALLTQGQYLLRSTNTGYLQFYQIAGANSVLVTGTTRQLTANTWVHVAVTRTSATGTITLYTNAVADATTGTSTAASICSDVNRGNTCIGRAGDYAGAGEYLNGIHGEYRIYNRALSLAELTRNRDATKWRYGL